VYHGLSGLLLSTSVRMNKLPEDTEGRSGSEAEPLSIQGLVRCLWSQLGPMHGWGSQVLWFTGHQVEERGSNTGAA
jgi:hypothetical protein